MSHSSSATLMTDGSIWKRIIFFAIPLFWGNLFQQLYNTADALIVGNFLGSSALASVSSSGNLIFLLIGFFHGVAMGAGVVIAMYFGARDTSNLRRAIHTCIAFGLTCGILLTVVGIWSAPHLLRLIGTPEEILPGSITYFQIYFTGSLAFVLYNFLVGILQSVGDSRHPLIYLVISSITNIVLDILFIGVMGFGVGAAALATVISQYISAILCIIQLMRSPEEFRLKIKEIRFSKSMMHQIMVNGIPTGIQYSFISIANVFVQANINAFGALAVAGCGAYSKIQGFGFLPITCFTMALSTFVSQNLGAKKYERAKKGTIFGILCCTIIAELIGIAVRLCVPWLLTAFDRNPEVISFGISQARTDTLFYFLLAFTHCMAAIFRGAGHAIFPTIVMLVCWGIIRIGFISVAVSIFPVISSVFVAYPLTWTLSSITFLVYYLKADWIHGLD